MDIFNPNSIEETFPINLCRCCLVEGCYKDISSEYFFSGKKEIYEEMLKDVFNLEISFQKYGGPSRYSRLICENCIGKLRDAKEFKYKVLESEKSFIKYLEEMQINTKEEENNHQADIISGQCAIKEEPELSTDNDVESCENDIFGNSQVVNYYDLLGIKIESESNIDNEIESHGIVKDQTEENHTDVMSVKLESESNTDNEIESNETLEDYTKKNHIVNLENIKLYVNKNLNNKLNGGANVCDKRKLTTEVNTKKKRTKLADEGTNSDYESGAPGLPFKKKLRTEIVHKKCVTTYLGQDFKPTETQSTDNELRRGLPLQIIGELVIEHDNNQMEVDDVNPTIYHVHKPRQIIGDRFNKRPKTSAERVREFRARKAMLKQQSKQRQEPVAIVEIAAEDIRSAGPSEDKQDPGPSEITTIEERAKSAEETRRLKKQAKTDIAIEHYNYQMEVDNGNPTIDHVQKPRQMISYRFNKRPKTSAERVREFRARKALLKQQSKQQHEPDATVEIAAEDIRSAGPSEDNQDPGPSEITTNKKGVSETSKKQAKTAAQRMREYRQRQKLAKKIPLEPQSDQDLDAIVSTSSSQVNQRAGPSTINSIYAELTRRGISQS
ncbi:unnamed protein product [Parnassius apollo]|uniref:(apollo) hypothetical protein n=1 Tax=Parnassius apollo TaxID=110799 RepID=A0A8S3YC19_PARAO|nr:unnamed protein product [Parnassius apollo]